MQSLFIVQLQRTKQAKNRVKEQTKLKTEHTKNIVMYSSIASFSTVHLFSCFILFFSMIQLGFKKATQTKIAPYVKVNLFSLIFGFFIKNI